MVTRTLLNITFIRNTLSVLSGFGYNRFFPEFQTKFDDRSRCSVATRHARRATKDELTKSELPFHKSLAAIT